MSGAVSFASPEEFAEVCAAIAASLHVKNRVAMGESGFVWALADLVQRAGVAFRDRYDDPAVRAAFGDDWTMGNLKPEQRAAALFALLYPQDANLQTQVRPSP